MLPVTASLAMVALCCVYLMAVAVCCLARETPVVAMSVAAAPRTPLASAVGLLESMPRRRRRGVAEGSARTPTRPAGGGRMGGGGRKR